MNSQEIKVDYLKQILAAKKIQRAWKNGGKGKAAPPNIETKQEKIEMNALDVEEQAYPEQWPLWLIILEIYPLNL